jgi:hypothetical protein
MASTNSNINLSKKRHSFFSYFLSTKNLSIFRNKSSTTNDLSKNSKHYQSQINIHSEQTQIPVCISRGWLKKRSQRPISLDLDLVKDFLVNNEGHSIEQQPFRKHLGTIMDYLFINIRKEIVNMSRF